jgi:hypothetical protein
MVMTKCFMTVSRQENSLTERWFLGFYALFCEISWVGKEHVTSLGMGD